MYKSLTSKSGIHRLILLSAVLLSSSFSSVSFAQDNDAELRELRAQIEALSDRLEQLEYGSELRSTEIESNQSFAQTSSWVERFKISGDLRPRAENIDNSISDSDRNRNRVRARMAVDVQVADDWSASIGLASGSADPISTNQTLGGGGTTKDLRLDLAYINYTGFTNTTLSAGKYKNVFFKPGGQNLVFDGDYRPEGVALKYSGDSVFLNAGTMILESDDKFIGNDKETMWGMQVGYELNLAASSLILGTSYYEASVAGSRPFFINLPYGNSVDEAGAYLYNYEEWEVFAEANFSVAGKPLSIALDYVTNLDVSEFDTGWSLAAKLGSASGRGNWELGYGYQDLEADAILGSLTDSDFSGGGTDNSGHIIKAAYGLGANTKLGITYFINEYGEARLGDKIDYNRLQLDVQVGF